MVNITAEYEGSLHCTVRHGPSGAAIETDAPRDNHGRGEAFSPTDLVGAALATCAMTVMAIAARKEGLELKGMTAELQKGMVADPVRRIGSLPLRINVPGVLTAEHKALLERAGRTCPVASSLRDDLDASIEFRYPDE